MNEFVARQRGHCGDYRHASLNKKIRILKTKFSMALSLPRDLGKVEAQARIIRLVCQTAGCYIFG